MSLVCVLDEDGRILFFNEACERLDRLHARTRRSAATPASSSSLPRKPRPSARCSRTSGRPASRALRSGTGWRKTEARKLVAWSNKLMPGEDGASSILVTAGIDLSAPRKAPRTRAFEFDAEAKLHEVGRLAQEQRALRRVATLVASEASPERVFTAVSEECARVLEVDASAVFRYEGDDTATIVGDTDRVGGEDAFTSACASSPTRTPASAARCRPARPARIHDYTDKTGQSRGQHADHGLPLERRRRRSSSRASRGAPSESRAPNRCRPTRRHGSVHSASSSRSPSRAHRHART